MARDPTTSGHSGSGCPASSPEAAKLPKDIMVIPHALQWEIDRIPRNRKITHGPGLSRFAVGGIEPGGALFPNTIEEVSLRLSHPGFPSSGLIPNGTGAMPSTGIGSRGFLLQSRHSSLLQWHCRLESGSCILVTRSLFGGVGCGRPTGSWSRETVRQRGSPHSSCIEPEQLPGPTEPASCKDGPAIHRRCSWNQRRPTSASMWPRSSWMSPSALQAPDGRSLTTRQASASWYLV